MIPASLLILVGLILVAIFIGVVVREYNELRDKVKQQDELNAVTRNMVSDVYAHIPAELPRLREAVEKWLALTSPYKR